MKRLRLFFFNLLEPSSSKKDPNKYFDYFIIALIILNVLAVILESEQSLKLKYHTFFKQFEVFSVIVFSIEYILRIWTCVEKKEYRGAVKGRIKFALSPMAIIDLLAVLPFYLPFLGIDLRFIRIFRLFRVFRIVKMARYTSAFYLIRDVVKDKREELLISLVFILILLIVVSSLMYYAEKDIQPEYFSSIPKAIWWGLYTLTGVGYGDIYPLTMAGKIMGGLISLLGIGFFALPTGILASGFSEQISKRKKVK